MRSERIPLYKWYSDNLPDTIDINWPDVHKAVGREQMSWILKQPKEQCQLVVDKLNENFTLVAEFYCEQALIAYRLMWAK